MDNDVDAYNWSDIPAREMRPGIMQRALRGDGVIVTYNFLAPDLKPGPHRHPFDQIFMIISGRVTLHIEDEVFDCGPGSVVRIPPNALHWVDPPDPKDGVAVNIDVFGPAREDYVHLTSYQKSKFDT